MERDILNELHRQEMFRKRLRTGRVRKHARLIRPASARLPLVTYLRGGPPSVTHYSYGEGSLTIHIPRYDDKNGAIPLALMRVPQRWLHLM